MSECRTDGRCQYAIDHGAEGLGHCPEGKCAVSQTAAIQTGRYDIVVNGEPQPVPTNAPRSFTDVAISHAQELDQLRARNVTLERELAEAKVDADRWRWLPAFLEKYQLDYVGLLKDIDAARKEGQ